MGMLSPNFFIHTIRIGSLEGASCVNVGNNFPSGFTSHKKHNQGFGSIQGDHNDISRMMSRLDDEDEIDMLNSSNFDEDVPDWVKQMLFSHIENPDEEDSKDESESHF